MELSFLITAEQKVILLGKPTSSSSWSLFLEYLSACSQEMKMYSENEYSTVKMYSDQRKEGCICLVGTNFFLVQTFQLCI